MARRIIGISKRLIEVAGHEFAECGFEGASIRTIAQKAETTPRAVYTRFANKEELFAAVVEPAVSDFMKRFNDDKIAYWERAQNRDFSVPNEDIYKSYLDFVYRHKKEFLLVLTASTGTRYQNFTRNLAETDLKGMRQNLPKILELPETVRYDEPDRLFLENITYSFYENLFDPLVQGTALEDAKLYITKLTQFYNAGIMSVSAIQDNNLALR